MLATFSASAFDVVIGAAALIAFCVLTAIYIKLRLAADSQNIRAYWAFFTGVGAIAAYVFIVARLLGPAALVEQGPTYFAVLAFAVLVFFIAFRTAFMPKTVQGKVLSAGGGWAVVQLDYHFTAGIQAGPYAVADPVGVRKGQQVSVGLRKRWLGRPAPAVIVA